MPKNNCFHLQSESKLTTRIELLRLLAANANNILERNFALENDLG